MQGLTFYHAKLANMAKLNKMNTQKKTEFFMQIKKTIISMNRVSMFIIINKKFENVSLFTNF